MSSTSRSETSSTDPNAIGTDADAHESGVGVGRTVLIFLSALVAVAAIAFALLAFTWGGGGDSADGFDYVVIVPAGTGARIDAGEALDLMPHDVNLRVDDALVVDNRDDRVHVVGPFTVRPGERFEYRFDEPGRYVGGCTIGDSGEIVITVT